MSRLEQKNRCIAWPRAAKDPVPRPESGRGKVATVIVSALIVVVGFVGYNVVPFYYYYFELTNQLRALISTADRNNDAAIRARVMRIVRELEIPADDTTSIASGSGRRLPGHSSTAAEIFFSYGDRYALPESVKSDRSPTFPIFKCIHALGCSSCLTLVQ